MNPSAARALRVSWLVLLAVAAVALVSCQSPQPATTEPPASQSGAPAAAASLTQVSVALDWYPWSNHTGLYMAQENGYYREEGLDVKIYVPSKPEDGLKLVAAGKDTFGINYHSQMLNAGAEGIPVKSVAALVQHPLNSVMTLKSSGITRPKQLEGKKVGYPGNPGNEGALATMMEKDGSSLDKVELVNVGFDLVKALIGKKVDAIIGAYWVHESILAEIEGYPVNIMRVEEWGVPDYYELLLITNEKMTREQPDVVRRFVRATGKGYADVMKDPEKALDILVKASPETNRKLEEQGMQLLLPLWTEGVPSFGWQTKERWQAFADWMRQKKLLTGDVEVDSVMTDEFLPR